MRTLHFLFISLLALAGAELLPAPQAAAVPAAQAAQPSRDAPPAAAPGATPGPGPNAPGTAFPEANGEAGARIYNGIDPETGDRIMRVQPAPGVGPQSPYYNMPIYPGYMPPAGWPGFSPRPPHRDPPPFKTGR
jgi:hypothetical protein